MGRLLGMAVVYGCFCPKGTMSLLMPAASCDAIFQESHYFELELRIWALKIEAI